MALHRASVPHTKRSHNLASSLAANSSFCGVKLPGTCGLGGVFFVVLGCVWNVHTLEATHINRGTKTSTSMHCSTRTYRPSMPQCHTGSTLPFSTHTLHSCHTRKHPKTTHTCPPPPRNNNSVPQHHFSVWVPQRRLSLQSWHCLSLAPRALQKPLLAWAKHCVPFNRPFGNSLMSAMS